MYPKTLFLSALLSLNFILLSGQTIHYDYDNSGNRTKKYIVLGKGNSSDDKISKESIDTTKIDDLKKVNNTEEFKENLGELTIKIYPNPTQGNLSVEISGLSLDETIYYQIFSRTGLLLEAKNGLGYQFTVNFERYPSGIYILRLIIKGKTSQWKILKE